MYTVVPKNKSAQRARWPVLGNRELSHYWAVETPGNNRKPAVFGAVNSRSGQTHFQFSAHKRSLDFQQFVDRQTVPA